MAEDQEKTGKGGKKFQERLPGEKRTRKNEVKNDRKPTGFGSGTRKSYTPREGDDRKRSFGNDRESGTRKPYTRREGDDRGTDRKRSFGNDRDGGTRKPYQTEKPVSRGRKPAISEEKPIRKTRGKTESNYEPASNFKGRGKEYRKTAEQRDKEENLASGEIRLNRFIAMSGKHSRREADTMISEGRVSVNNEVVTELGTHVGPSDMVKLDNQRIRAQKPVYILLNKPKGYVTTTEDQDGRATVMDLINLPGAENLFPVGRLDRNTTGVLLITNDGELAQRLMHPSFEIKKIYRVKLDRKPSKDHMLAWIEGIQLEDGPMSFEQVGFVEKNDQNVLGVEIKSGRNRIVRRMFEHFNYEVKSLDRVMLGEFDKINLGRGRWRFLNDKELRVVEKLKASAKRKR